MDGLVGDVEAMGAGPIARWLSDRLADLIGALGLEPVDLSLKKPVLTDSAQVIERSGMAGLADVQGMLRALPLGATDPGARRRRGGRAATRAPDAPARPPDAPNPVTTPPPRHRAA